MTGKVMRNMLLLAKLETTAGTDSVPVAGTNDILARGIAPTPVNAEFADRNLIQPYFGHTGQVQVQGYSTIQFEVELAGAGAAGTAPKWGPLIQACGFSETITAATKVDYAPLTNNQKSVTIYCFLDGVKHAMVGCKGNVNFTLNAAGIPVMQFTFTGYTAIITDATNPTGTDYSGFKPPLAVNKVNTPTFTLHGASVKAKELTVDMANVINYRNYIGAEDVAFTDRKPAGNCLIEYDAMAIKNWWSISNLGTLGALAFAHGTVAGNIIELAAPKVQITTQGLQDDTGIAMIPLGLIFQPNAGNDELILTVK